MSKNLVDDYLEGKYEDEVRYSKIKINKLSRPKDNTKTIKRNKKKKKRYDEVGSF